jgi:hypothetical protein
MAQLKASVLKTAISTLAASLPNNVDSATSSSSFENDKKGK